MNKENDLYCKAHNKKDLLSIGILKFIRQCLHLVIIPKQKHKLSTMFSLI